MSTQQAEMPRRTFVVQWSEERECGVSVHSAADLAKAEIEVQADEIDETVDWLFWDPIHEEAMEAPIGQAKAAGRDFSVWVCIIDAG